VFIVDRDSILDFSLFTPFLLVNTSTTDCLEKLVKKTYYVSSLILNSATTAASSRVHSVH